MIYQRENSFSVVGQASLVGGSDGDVMRAWAERHVWRDPDLKWIVGNYIEADRQNSNGHYFPLPDIPAGIETLRGKALNMLHRERYVVGHYVGAQLLDENGIEMTAEDVAARAEGSDDSKDIKAVARPTVEAVAAFHWTRFPGEFEDIQMAHSLGSLYFSMESIPKEVSCLTCDKRVAFDGLESETYCSHMNGPVGPKRLHEPRFLGGAIIIPPVKPGWSQAEIKTIARKMVEEDEDSVQALYSSFEETSPHLNPETWEALMMQVVLLHEGS